MKAFDSGQIKGAVGVSPSDYVDAVVLAASTAETLTVPTGANWVLIKSTDDIYVAYTPAGEATVTATVPVDTSDGSACECNPELRMITSIDEISIISEAAAKVTLAYFR